MPITAMTGVTATGKFLRINLDTTANSPIPANTAVDVKITTGATATSQTISVALFGFYAP